MQAEGKGLGVLLIAAEIIAFGILPDFPDYPGIVVLVRGYVGARSIATPATDPLSNKLKHIPFRLGKKFTSSEPKPPARHPVLDEVNEVDAKRTSTSWTTRSSRAGKSTANGCFNLPQGAHFRHSTKLFNPDRLGWAKRA
uniref:Uncharacterized protein n=1 Tax=Anopheles atroparvus TaxID=41427 RepID=A0A182IPQ5_ANOAO